MNKWLTLFLTALMGFTFAFGLAGCGGAGGEQEDTNTEDQAPEDPAPGNSTDDEVDVPSGEHPEDGSGSSDTPDDSGQEQDAPTGDGPLEDKANP